MPPAIRVLHAIDDYLPRHQAGSEIYVANLCAAQARAGAQPAVMAAEFDPTRAHGQLVWREHAGVPVAEVVNTWQFAWFEHTYTAPELTAALDHVLDMVQPHVLHVHNLLNLSFELPALARARGIPSSRRCTTTRWSVPPGASASIATSSTCATRSTRRGARAAFRPRPSTHRCTTASSLAAAGARSGTARPRAADRAPSLTTVAAAAGGRTGLLHDSVGDD